jgi:hypothetical protein
MLEAGDPLPVIPDPVGIEVETWPIVEMWAAANRAGAKKIWTEI